MEWLKLKYDKYKIKYNESDVECNHVRELVCKVESTLHWDDNRG